MKQKLTAKEKVELNRDKQILKELVHRARKKNALVDQPQYSTIK